MVMKIPLIHGIRMFAKNKKTLEVTEITNHLYFFEEEGIREIGEEGDHQGYEIWIELPDLKSTRNPQIQ